MANSLISMVKGDSTLINNTEVLNGQILFDETKQKIFLDDNAKRKEYGGSDDNAVKKDDVAYVESAMVATRGYSAGNYIIVQDTLYKATTQINSGTALVVGTNVSTTTVGNELTQINNDLTKKSLVNTYYDSSTKKLYEVNSDGTQGGEISMGNPTLNYANPLHTFNASNLSYTAVKDCYLVGSIHQLPTQSPSGISIDNKLIYRNDVYSSGSSTVGNGIVPITKIATGQTVSVTSAQEQLYILEESNS